MSQFPQNIHIGFAEIFNQESKQQLRNTLGAPHTLHGITLLFVTMSCHCLGLKWFGYKHSPITNTWIVLLFPMGEEMGSREGTARSVSDNWPQCRVVGHLKLSLLSWKDHPKSQGEMFGSPQSVPSKVSDVWRLSCKFYFSWLWHTIQHLRMKCWLLEEGNCSHQAKVLQKILSCRLQSPTGPNFVGVNCKSWLESKLICWATFHMYSQSVHQWYQTVQSSSCEQLFTDLGL